jgi:hypothetical protein
MPELPLAATATPALPVPLSAPDPAAEIEALVARYLRAQGGPVELVALVGGQVEGMARRLPEKARRRIDSAVRIALGTAYGAAQGSHRARPGGDRAHRLAAAALGAVGGLGGLPSALAELPVTTATILRSLQEIARAHGEDPADEETRLACLQVLGSGGPLPHDDGTDLAFLGARVTLTGAAVNNLIAQIAPSFAAVLARKLATKAVPALGAAAGAAVNLAFARYYQEMAHVHFGLRRLARHGVLDAPAAFRARVEAVRAVRRT